MKQRRVLIGFVNQFYTPLLNLGILDLNTKKFQWVTNKELEKATVNVHGVNGLGINNNFIFVGYQSNPTKILIFDRKFNIIKELVLEQIKQLHSFTFIDDRIYCVSTGTGEIFELHLDNNFSIKNIKSIFQYSDVKKDIIHVNSITNVNNKLLATCFGEKINDSWKNVSNGKLFNVRDNEEIVSNLYQPHSAFTIDGKWLLCESGTGKLIFERGESILIGGYVRGIDHNENNIFVGVSGRRIKSRSMGTLNVDIATSINENKSFIKVLSKKTKKVILSVDLSIYGTEIFDIKLLDEKFNYHNEIEFYKLQIEHLENRIMKLESETKERSLRNALKTKLKKFL